MFGPRHAHREARILSALDRRARPGPGRRHLECAAGLGSLSRAVAGRGADVVAADRSLATLVGLSRRPPIATGAQADSSTTAGSREPGRVLPVVADITCLPFEDQAFDSASTAETLEHVEDHAAAVSELARVLRPGGWLVGTVPAEGRGWADWDRWAGHLRRYTSQSLGTLLAQAGLDARVVRWGWPVVWIYDRLFLRRLNRRRLARDDSAAGPGTGTEDRTLKVVAGLGRRPWLVGLVRAVLALDRAADGAPWGVGLLLEAQRPAAPRRSPDEDPARGSRSGGALG
jgi:SAM-dependent methyltransferase